MSSVATLDSADLVYLFIYLFTVSASKCKLPISRNLLNLYPWAERNRGTSPHVSAQFVFTAHATDWTPSVSLSPLNSSESPGTRGRAEPARPQVQLIFRVMIYFVSYGHARSQENWGLPSLPKDLHLQWFIHLESEANSFLKIFFSIGQLAHCCKEPLPKCVYTYLYSQRVHCQIHRTISLASSTVLMPTQTEEADHGK